MERTAAKRFFAFILFFASLAPEFSFPITVEQAVSMAKENLPSYKASAIQVRSAEALYSASLSPYFPSVDAATSQEHHIAPEPLGNYDLGSYDVTASYTLFDGGRRRANRNIAGLNLNIDQQELQKNCIELRFNVMAAFYTAMARKEILEERKVQLHDARKDLEIAQGRNRLGASKLSDVLQASVRSEQAKYNVVQGEGELAKAVSELNSLLGRPLKTPYDLEGSLQVELLVPDPERLSAAALQRPEIKQGESVVKISQNNKAIETSTFFPTISAVASYNKVDSPLTKSFLNEDSTIGLRATWNIFELGKFYKRKSAEFQIHVSQEQLNETVRKLLLNLTKAYEDYVTAGRNVSVAREQLTAAEHNYSQALGEYKVGKGDILSLVLAEGMLSSAREQLTVSKLNLMLSKSLLERATGVEKLESLGS